MIKRLTAAGLSAALIASPGFAQDASSPQVEDERTAEQPADADQPFEADDPGQAEDSSADDIRSRLNRLFGVQTTDEPSAAPVATETEEQRLSKTVVLRALDKVTAQFKDIDVKIDEPIEFGTLEIVARTCHKRPPEETPETTAFLEIADLGVERNGSERAVDVAAGRAEPQEEASLLRLGGVDAVAEAGDELSAQGDQIDLREPEPEILGPLSIAREAPETFEFGARNDVDAGREAAPALDKLFVGWMFASSPALNALEHPVYDVWVIDCKTSSPDI